MDLAAIDWIIIVAFLGISLAIGMYYRNKASASLTDFFLGGRNLPWYIVGVSMVATTFAADTPLAVSEFVSQNGIAGNWIWWCFLSGGLLTTFFFANLWRRAGILTEIELINLRYSGLKARLLRGFKSVYLGVFINVIIIAWVNKAMESLLVEFFGLEGTTVLLVIFGLMAFAAFYSSLSGLMGVAITDFVQFIIAMTGTIILAFVVINSEEVGGISNLQAKLPASYFDFFPSWDAGGDSSSPGGSMVGTLSLSIGAFLSFAVVQWWASWYPGAEPGGGGYIAQRMMSAKNEKHAVWSTLFFQVAHYCLRPWPWILVGLAAVALYSPEYSVPDVTIQQQIEAVKAAGIDFKDIGSFDPALAAEMAKDPTVERATRYTLEQRAGYVFAMKDFLPTGLVGLLLAAFFAAYLSTISTQLNWGASYLINDLYVPFVQKSQGGTEAQKQKKYVLLGRAATVFLMILGLAATPLLDSIKEGWSFLMNCGAGLGLVLILRWYWWRINAWSEISATLAPFVAYPLSVALLESNPSFGEAFVHHNGTFLVTVLFTTIVWITVTFLTEPTNTDTLRSFYDRVRPDGAWGPFQAKAGSGEKSNLPYLFLCWISAVVLVYSLLFATGKVIFGDWPAAGTWGIGILVGALGLMVGLSRTKILQD